MMISIIYVLISFSLFFTSIGAKKRFMSAAIVNRWIRWILMSLCFAYVFKTMEWSSKPEWLLFLTAFLGWFVLETAYNWLAIRALNRSDIPLFPNYRKDPEGVFWPAFFLKEKETIEVLGFKKTDVLFMDMGEGVKLHSVFFENEPKTIRLQVTFLPQVNKPFAVFYTLFSATKESLYQTDNTGLPFGGFFPSHWSAFRRPLYSFKKLYDAHKKRLENTVLLPWTITALEQMVQQQRLLECYNIEKGFVQKRESFSEGEGRISPEGCYRMWKELWFLNYLGRTLSY
jgi:hypothetical protein